MKNLAETNNIQYIITFFVMLLTLLGCEDSSSSIALGTLERERIAHTATANEVVVALPIAQGARVNLGDVLVQLDSRQQTALTSKAQTYVAKAQANLEKQRNGARPEEVAATSVNLKEQKRRKKKVNPVIFEPKILYLKA